LIRSASGALSWNSARLGLALRLQVPLDPQQGRLLVSMLYLCFTYALLMLYHTTRSNGDCSSACFTYALLMLYHTTRSKGDYSSACFTYALLMLYLCFTYALLMLCFCFTYALLMLYLACSATRMLELAAMEVKLVA
jgi:hypothetical protein